MTVKDKGAQMADTKRIITVDDFEHRLLVGCLTTAHNKYIEDGKPVEDVNELIIKAIDAPTKKEKRSNIREGR